MSEVLNIKGAIPPFSRYPVTNKLIEFFANTKPGDEFSYDEIDRAAGCARDAWSGTLPTVRKVLLDRYQIRLLTVPGVGLRHAADGDVVDAAKQRGRSAHRQYTQAAREFNQGVKHHDKLTPEQQRVGVMVTTMAGLTSPKAERALSSARVANDQLDAGGFLDLMRRKLTE